MHVARTSRHYKGKTYESFLLRRSYREDGKVKNQTLANLSHLPAEAIDAIRRVLAGETMVGAGDVFEITRSRPHGAAAAVTVAARQLGLVKLLGPACAERDIAFALIIARVLRPGSKLATTRWWADSTLVDLGVGDTTTDGVYQSMDWLVERQDRIEETLAKRHLTNGGVAMFDLTSAWMEGSCCPLAQRGYSRDRKGGKTQIEYGLLTDGDGRPVAVEVFAGNTADPTAFTSMVRTVVDRFGLDRIVLVGDRGMITTARIDAMKQTDPGLGWITALRAPAIRKLAADTGPLQLSLFDETNLAEIVSPEFPGERLIACRNPALAELRAHKRCDLLDATDLILNKIVAAVDAGRLADPAKIGERVGRQANKYKMAKHYDYTITQGTFTYRRLDDQIAAEAALDGIYVIRTSVAADTLNTAAVVEAYKNLSAVEANFRSIKTIDLDLRPIHHHLETRVRAHILICMLAAYLVWHLRHRLKRRYLRHRIPVLNKTHTSLEKLLIDSPGLFLRRWSVRVRHDSSRYKLRIAGVSVRCSNCPLFRRFGIRYDRTAFDGHIPPLLAQTVAVGTGPYLGIGELRTLYRGGCDRNSRVATIATPGWRACRHHEDGAQNNSTTSHSRASTVGLPNDVMCTLCTECKAKKSGDCRQPTICRRTSNPDA